MLKKIEYGLLEQRVHKEHKQRRNNKDERNDATSSVGKKMMNKMVILIVERELQSFVFGFYPFLHSIIYIICIIGLGEPDQYYFPLI